MIDQKVMKKHRPNLLLLSLMMGMAIPIMIYLGLWIGYQSLASSDYIFNGVTVAGIPLGNQSRATAIDTLQTNWQEATIGLRIGQEINYLPPSDLGFELDVERAVDVAYKQGRTFRPDWLAPWYLLTLDAQLDSEMIPNWLVAREKLTQLSAELNQEPIEPALIIRDGKAIAQTGKAGRTVDIEGTVADWEANWPQTPLSLHFITLEPNQADLTSFVAPFQAIIDRPLSLTAYDPIMDKEIALDLDQKTWSTWLSAEVVDGTLQLTTLEDPIIAFFGQLNQRWTDHYLPPQELSSIEQAVEQQRDRVELRLYHPPITYTVEAGDTLSRIGRKYGIPYPWIQQANPNATDLQVGQEIIIPSADSFIPLPIVRHKRIRVSIAQQKMWAYENEQLKWEWTISTGIAESPTAPGIFQIRSHELEAYAATWNLYMPYFMGIYQPIPNSDFMNGFHGFPTRDGRNLLWTNNLGSPTTYGCILVDNQQIPLLYDWAEEGVIVVIEAE